MHDELATIRSGAGKSSGDVAASAPVSANPLRVALLYQPNVPSDERLMTLLHERLVEENCQVFVDRRVTIDVAWAREIEGEIAQADAVIALLSKASVESELIAYEIEVANQTSGDQPEKARIIPVRLQFSDPLPSQMASLLDSLTQIHWAGPMDDEQAMRGVLEALRSNHPAGSAKVRPVLESPGGAVPLASKFYVVRHVDEEFESSIARGTTNRR